MRRMHFRSLNVLSAENTYSLFSSLQLLDDKVLSITTQLLFTIALQTTLLPSELYLSRWGPDSSVNYNGASSESFKKRLGATDGISETTQGERKNMRMKPKDKSIFDETVALKSVYASKLLSIARRFATIEKHMLFQGKFTFAADSNDRF